MSDSSIASTLTGTTEPTAGTAVSPPPASSISGTINMYADETAEITYDYIIPTGALSPPTPVQVTQDTPSLATITTSGPVPGAYAIGFIDTVTIVGGGVAGTQTIHAMEQGTDVSDIVLNLVARPSISGTFDISSVVISETMVSSTAD